MTLGEKRVRVNFNVSNDSDVQKIKENSAKLIDEINNLQNKKLEGEELSEFNRLKSLAITHIENGCMWAVKAATI